MAIVVLEIPRLGDPCDPCEDKVAEALTALHGVHVVYAESGSGAARVEFDEARVGVEQMRDALERAQFPAVSVR